MSRLQADFARYIDTEMINGGKGGAVTWQSQTVEGAVLSYRIGVLDMLNAITERNFEVRASEIKSILGMSAIDAYLLIQKAYKQAEQLSKAADSANGIDETKRTEKTS